MKRQLEQLFLETKCEKCQTAMNHNPKLRIRDIKFFMIVWGRLTYAYTYLIDRVDMDI